MKLAVHIKRMPIELANKIAAGEVVQRPASAVKELVENAIDAGATEISVLIKASGSNLIQVRDNGIGMSPEDAVTCFERHATSKIIHSDDLENIQTLGFRGEALASVAAIAQVTAKTRRNEDPHGTQVRIEGGEVIETAPCATGVGTTIEVRNLFFNVPARRSFLKAPSTEFRHISETIASLSLANPWTMFKLEHEQQEIYQLAGSQKDSFLDALRERLRILLGSKVVQYIMQVDEPTTYISVSGFLAHPEHARKSRRDQYLFVNGRPIKSPSLHHAIRSAYDAILPEGRQPLYALFISVDPKTIDVNVHPSKLEVRFEDDRAVYNFMQAACKRALGVADLIPQYSDSVTSLSFQGGRDRSSSSWAPPPRAEDLPSLHAPQKEILFEFEPSRLPKGVEPEPSGFLWQFQDQYILTQLNRGILIIDQHAAHQRILFEKALDDIRSGTGLSQQLLFPYIICLTKHDCSLLQELAPLAKSIGLDYSISENRTVTVRGVPSHLRTGAEKKILHSILEAYKDNAEAQIAPLPMEENMARSIAVSGAIQPRVSMNEEEMRTLIDCLFECKEPDRTPNGKPTFIRLTHDELKKRFDQRLPDHAQPD